MKNINRTAICLTLWAGLAIPSMALADVVLEYQVRESGDPAGITQRIAVKNDQIMVKAAGGDKNLDLLYVHAAESVMIVDHRKGTVMAVDEQQIDRLNQETQAVQPLLQGLGEQIAGLSPDQRRNLQELLGDNVSLAKIAKGAQPQAPIRLVPAGERKTAGIRCKTMRVMQGETPVAEVCLGEAALMKISDNDAATIRALLGLYERLAAKSQKLACQLGLSLPNITAREVTGIPVEIRELAGKENGSMTLSRIDTSPVSPDRMRIPRGYKSVPLTLWP